MSKDIKVRDKRNKGWFYLDNEYLNGLGKQLGAIGVAVYVSLCRHANEEQFCFPSQETIAEELNISPRTVKRYIGLLVEHNVIYIERTKTGRKWAHNTYYLLDKSEWIYNKNPSGDTVARDIQGTETTVSGDRNDNVQGTQLHTKNTNKKNTNKEQGAPSGAWVSLKEEIKKLEDSSRRDLNIIALYLSERNPDIQNAEQYQVTLARHLRPAKALIAFTDEQILNGVQKAKNKYPEEWTLETVTKILTK